MQIRIDDEIYHNNCSSPETDAFIRDVIAKLSSSSSGTFDCFEQYSVSKIIEQDFKEKVIMAVAKSLKDRYHDKLGEEQFYKAIYTTINTVAHPLMFNYSSLGIHRTFSYEPECSMTLYLANEIEELLDKHLQDPSYVFSLTPFKCYFLLLLRNIANSIKSIIVLSSIGDDAHAMSLIRGAMEQVATIILINKGYKDEWVRFREISEQIRNSKFRGEELPNSAKEFMAENNLNEKNVDHFLMCGWVKNSKGERCRSFKAMLQAALPNEWKKNYSAYSYFSNFTHDNYVGMSVNWVQRRIDVKAFVTMYLITVMNALSELEPKWISTNNARIFLDLKVYCNPNKFLESIK